MIIEDQFVEVRDGGGSVTEDGNRGRSGFGSLRMLPDKRLGRTVSALLLAQGKAFTVRSYGNFCSY